MTIKLDKFQFILLILIGFFLTIVISIPFRIAIARMQVTQPQLIFVLGGDHTREIFAAQFAQKAPNLPIWISSGSKDEKLFKTFAQASVKRERLYIDRRANDTVTNFTSLVKDFQKQKIRHLYLITSDYHMLRASAIATVVLGSRGIAFTSISVPGTRPQESQLRVYRDTARALVWIVTGFTGSSLKKHLAMKK
ncbi:MAG: YdcF family protein [Xenococcaceae cyanobacterium MO_167.B27]|nr:YdcF family protein [Xenococcaceae cyanobacterium MO_167.B27]